jgi:ATP-binding cassette subfamily B protein
MSVSRYISQVLYNTRWWLYAQTLVGVVWAFDLSFRPYLIKKILDALMVTTPATVYHDIAVPVILYIAMSLIMVGVFRLYDYTIIMVSPAIKKYIAETLIYHLMRHSHGFYQIHFAGSLGNKVRDAMSGMADLVKKVIDRFIAHGLAIIIAIITLWMVNSLFAAALTIWVVVFCIVAAFMSQRAHKLSEAAAAKQSALVGYLVDVIGAMMTVRLFTGMQQERENLSQKLQKYSTAQRERALFFLYLFTFQGLSFVVYQALCLWWLTYYFKQGNITAGDFALVLSINSAIVDCLWYLVQGVEECVELYGEVTQGLQTILVPPSIVDATTAMPLVVARGAIRFDHVSFQYKTQEPLFNGLSIDIPGGQKVGLVGFSGSGKTTFINLILRIFDISDGAIYIDDQNIKEVTQDSLRHAIGIVPQDPAFFNRSVMDNIRYGKPTATDEEVIEAAKKAHAHEFIMRMPHVYNAMIGERGAKLSGGQRQRFAIARAMLKNAPILILDEATSALDTVTEHKIQDALKILMDGKTVLAVAHRLSTIEAMDRILVFEKGAIVEDGSHHELITRNGVYAKLWAMQSGGMLQERKTA